MRIFNRNLSYFKQLQKDYLFASLFFIVNFIIKIIHLDTNPVSLDEPWSIFYSQFDLFEMVSRLYYSDNHPPLYYIILNIWTHVFDISSFSARFPSLIFSCLTVVVIYYTCVRFFNRKTAILAGIIYTFSTISIYFAHEARSYSQFQLLTVLSFYVWLLYIQNGFKRNHIILLLITNLALLYTNYFGGLIVVVEFICSYIFFNTPRRNFRYLIWSNVLLIILFSPYIYAFFFRFFKSAESGTWMPPFNYKGIYYLFAKFSNDPVPAVIFICLLVYSIVYAFVSKKENHFLKLNLMFFFAPTIFLAVISLKMPMFHSRYLFFLTPFYYIIIASAVEYLFANKILNTVVIFGVALTSILSVNINKSMNRDPIELIYKIKTLKDNNSIVMIYPEYDDLYYMYHYNINCFKNYKQFDNCVNENGFYPLYSGYNILEILQNTNPEKVILLQSKDNKSPTIDITLSEQFARFESIPLSSKNNYLTLTVYYKFDQGLN